MQFAICNLLFLCFRSSGPDYVTQPKENQTRSRAVISWRPTTMADWTYESTVALDPSSTLEYLNSQLVSQGYVPPPGLQLQVLQGKDQERAIRCILSLLSQRVDDLRRFENANAKYKTQTFELDRYRTMWREECEKSANAEREMTLFKSKLTGSQKQVEELQKKCQATLVDLSRTKSTLLSVRNGAAMEVKRKEKEVERLLERFQKVAGSATLRVTGQTPVEEAAHNRVLKSDKGLVEEALELAEAELDDLKGERERLHDVFIWTARELSALVADGTEVGLPQLQSQSTYAHCRLTRNLVSPIPPKPLLPYLALSDCDCLRRNRMMLSTLGFKVSLQD
jgi:hypothetical protein